MTNDLLHLRCLVRAASFASTGIPTTILDELGQLDSLPPLQRSAHIHVCIRLLEDHLRSVPGIVPATAPCTDPPTTEPSWLNAAPGP